MSAPELSPLDVPPEIAARNALRDSYESVMFGGIDDLDLDALKDQLEDRGWKWTGCPARHGGCSLRSGPRRSSSGSCSTPHPLRNR